VTDECNNPFLKIKWWMNIITFKVQSERILSPKITKKITEIFETMGRIKYSGFIPHENIFILKYEDKRDMKESYNPLTIKQLDSNLKKFRILTSFSVKSFKYNRSELRKYVKIPILNEGEVSLCDLEKKEPKRKKQRVKVEDRKDIQEGITFDEIFQNYYLDEIRNWAIEHGVKMTGTKTVLIKRIIAFLDHNKVEPFDYLRQRRGEMKQKSGSDIDSELLERRPKRVPPKDELDRDLENLRNDLKNYDESNY
jgi:hypothetical protein